MTSILNTVLLDGRPVTPSKIICIGRNYVEHIRELGNEVPEEMVVFVKPNSAISSTLHAKLDEPLHYEGEISFMVIGCKLAAVGFGLDITKRGLQGRLKAKGLPWERAKAFDGAALFSPFVRLQDWDDSLSVELSINGQQRQAGNVSLMMYKPDEILRELATFMTLNDGDIIMTGTPQGVGGIISGDKFSGRISLAGEIISAEDWVAL
jgi:2-keto-4-pentenoate hydratase/2-oxohepta-3-ene-1,7-dioic acid hydratase in catechol pathway